jgi:cytochrome d ubiquinol oxidase subunit II
MSLNLLWFFLLGKLLAGYAVLDGFDLGVGIIHLLVGNDLDERQIFRGAIQPIWDGNEVWLVAFGGVTFAAFPEVYATVFSGFYWLFMPALAALICRAVSLEFHGKVHAAAWRHFWDRVFCLSSLAATVCFGLGVGNAMVGVPLDARGTFIGDVRDFLNPYACAVALLSVTLFALHGTVFLHLKTVGRLQERMREWMRKVYVLFVVVDMGVAVMTILHVPRATLNLQEHPWTWGLLALHILVLAGLFRAIHQRQGASAFVWSGATIGVLVMLFGLSLFPYLVASSPHPENSLTIYNAASSPQTLRILTVIAAIGIPFVLAYTWMVYRVFRGKVDPDRLGY